MLLMVPSWCTGFNLQTSLIGRAIKFWGKLQMLLRHCVLHTILQDAREDQQAADAPQA
jgi:hypothetical protein